MRQLIGASIHRLEDEALLRGKGRFLDDIAVPDVLHAAFVRSPYAHARVSTIACEAARAQAGVVAVLTLDDLAGVMTSRRMLRTSNSGKPLDRVWPFALADKEVSYVGEPVAIVIAEDRYVAEDAAALIEVDYAPLPPVVDCRQAAQDGAPPVRAELKSNVVATFKLGFGDVEAAFANAAHVFTQELWQQRGGGHSIEGRGILAEVRSADNGLTVWASTQKAHDLKQSLARLIDLDEDRLRVATPDVGGGFGPKLCVYSEDVAVVAAARLIGRSIKWVEDRREHFTNAVQERDQFWSMRIAVDADGTVLGLRGSLLHDQGAYALQDVNLPYNSATAVTGPYIVPALAMEVSVALTNRTPVSSVRGAGYPQAAFTIERLLDRVARELKLDRAEVRRRNLIPAEKMPYEKPLKARSGAGMTYDSGDYPAAQASVLAAIGWDGFPQRQAEARRKGHHLGIGLANAVKGTGRGPFESSLVRIAPSGRVFVTTGAAAMGQGLRTALAQICAEQFGVAATEVTVTSGDTAAIPLGLGGFASRQLVTAGSSVLLASRAVAEKAKQLASHMLEAAEHDLEISDGTVHVAGAPQLAVELGELARILQGAPGYAFPEGLEPGLEASAHFRTDALAYANACHAAEVEVDIETGAVRILRYVAIQDCGRLVNPMIVEGQIHGGIVHGISNALFEQMRYDEEGQPTTTTFADYLLPTATDVPAIETMYRQSPSPLNPLGAKGVGEVGTIPAAAAVISAVEDALAPYNVRIDKTPITPVDVRAMVRKR